MHTTISKHVAATGLFLAAALVSPLTPGAICDANNPCLGPNNPVMMDTQPDGGDGVPDKEIPITKSASGNSYRIESDWQCSEHAGGDTIWITRYDGDVATEWTRYHSSLSQVLSFSGEEGDMNYGVPIRYFFREVNYMHTPEQVRHGMVEFINPTDGKYTGLRLTECRTACNDPSDDPDLQVERTLEMDLVTNDPDPSHPRYVSLPWGNATQLNTVQKGNCPADGSRVIPQVWFPLSSTDPSSRPTVFNTVIFDLNGDNVEDPDSRRSPPLQPIANPGPFFVLAGIGGGAAVPMLSDVMLLLLMAAMAFTGWYYSRKRVFDGSKRPGE